MSEEPTRYRVWPEAECPACGHVWVHEGEDYPREEDSPIPEEGRATEDICPSCGAEVCVYDAWVVLACSWQTVEAKRAEDEDEARRLREYDAAAPERERQRRAEKLATVEPLFGEPGSVVEAEWMTDALEASEK